MVIRTGLGQFDGVEDIEQNVASTTPTPPSAQMRQAELQAMALQTALYVPDVNKVGAIICTDGDRSYPGRSLAVNREGNIVAVAVDREGLVTADVESAAVRERRDVLRLFEHRRPKHHETLVLS